MTTPDQSKGDRSKDEVLAGEYVLGVLSLDARQVVEARIKRDRQFAAIVHRWEENLSQFNEDYKPESPKPESFAEIENRLADKNRTVLMPQIMVLWQSLAFWRLMTLMSVIAVSSLIGLELGAWEDRYGYHPLVADLAAKDDKLSLVASYDRLNGRLRVSPVASSGQGEKSLELWLIDGTHPAQSLGVLPQTGDGVVLVPDEMRRKLKSGITLAVSLEPFGGSPTGVATGPVIAAGTVHLP
ncbi:anti-sigma factor [Allorhizobium sp. BGMRC 0089]|uniref:anti-sigma factor n=1 Tax=Allorhizobium sonneratiae TaxID=2934936 RepID=UPI0020336657|nr:anti-sigma factor [Allorhizobium sonneratiae]MCM2291500.1 anti-sigma factor [Allorhizobium sonneratiae]